MARQDATCNNLKEEKKKTYVTSKVWYREFSRISNIGIAIIEKWIAFRDRDALNSNPVRTTISPAVFIGFFQYHTQGIITMSQASWEKLLFFFGLFSGRFLPFLGLSVRLYVPLYLLQFLSDSFNIAHRASLQCCGRHGRNIFFRVIFGPFSAIFRLKIKILWILSILHTGHGYYIASVIKRNFFMIG